MAPTFLGVMHAASPVLLSAPHPLVAPPAAADPLSQQALEVQAQDLALEDALYALDKALNAGAIEPDAYLKQARQQHPRRQPCFVSAMPACSMTHAP